MLTAIKNWLSPPVIPGDAEKNRLAKLLNVITIALISYICMAIPIHLTSGNTQLDIVILDICVLIVNIWLYFQLRRGKVLLVGGVLMILVFAWLTISSFGQGTVRNPATAGYVFVAALAGLIFDRRAILLAVIASSLAVAGLILAQNYGLMHQADYSVSFIHWFTYTGLFVITGAVSFFTIQVMRDSLARAEKEIGERDRVEMELRKLTRAVEQSPDSIVITNLSGSIEYVNPQFTQVTGYSPSEAAGKNPRILKTDLTESGTYSVLWETLKAGRVWHGEFVNRKKDGSFFNESATIAPIYNPSGDVTHYLAVKQDITERKRVEEALQKSEERYRLLAENVSDVIWILDLDKGVFRYISPSVERLRGYTVEEVLVQDFGQAISPNSLSYLNEELPARIQAFRDGYQRSYVDEIEQPCKDGSSVWTEANTRFVLNVSDGHLDVYGVSRNVNERKQAEEALRISMKYFQDLVENLPVAYQSLDKDGCFLEVNEDWLDMLGYSRAEVIGKSFADFWPSETRPAFQKHFDSFKLSGLITDAEIPLVRKSGLTLVSLLTGRVQLDSSGKFKRMHCFILDITERQREQTAMQTANEKLIQQMGKIEYLQAELREQAVRDPLTGLHNRRYLDESIEREVKRMKRENAHLSVIVSDIDHFKNINDSHGHQVGDKFLVEISALMRKNVRESDIVCRYGGEEFLLVLPGTSQESALRHAEDLRKKCAQLVIPYEGNELCVTMSFGVATFPTHGSLAEEVIIKADKALYYSKRSGRDRVTVWSQELVG